jgi:GTP-binding protein
LLERSWSWSRKSQTGRSSWKDCIGGRFANARENNLEVNVAKTKHLTNIRSATSDIAVRLTHPTEMSPDRCLEYIGPDELVEVTPKNVRMRKKELDAKIRRRAEKREEEYAR